EAQFVSREAALAESSRALGRLRSTGHFVALQLKLQCERKACAAGICGGIPLAANRITARGGRRRGSRLCSRGTASSRRCALELEPSALASELPFAGNLIAVQGRGDGAFVATGIELHNDLAVVVGSASDCGRSLRRLDFAGNFAVFIFNFDGQRNITNLIALGDAFVFA